MKKTKVLLSLLIMLALLGGLIAWAADPSLDTVTITQKEYDALRAGQGDGKTPEGMILVNKAEYDRLSQYKLLDEARRYVEEGYFEEPDQQKMMDGAIQGLLTSQGDGYTFYYPKDAWKKLWEDDKGKYAGIGIQMLGNPTDGIVTIIRVFKDTPAEAAGIKKGDILTKVGDFAINTTTMQEAVDKMRGVPGDDVTVEVLRQGETLTFDLKKAEITVNRVESKMLDNKVGLIVLYEFAGDVTEGFHKAYEELMADGMTSLILDLRDNPGGWVQSGTDIADQFLGDDLLYYTEDRHGAQVKTFTKKGADDIPLVVLINGHSASTSEIFSAAMKDYGRATLVGEKSFGKGIIQYVVGLSDNESGMQYTVQQYFSPKGNKVHKEGVTPDIEVAMPEDLKNSYFAIGDMADPQLKAAYDKALEKVGVKP